MRITDSKVKICFDCKQHTDSFGKDKDENLICYECCGKRDKQQMLDTGTFVGYLTRKPSKHIVQGVVDPSFYTLRVTTELQGFQPGKFGNLRSEEWTLSNWPGTLEFSVQGVERHKINGIERERITFRFLGPDGKVWSGIQRGTNTDIARCKRTKLKHIRENW